MKKPDDLLSTELLDIVKRIVQLSNTADTYDEFGELVDEILMENDLVEVFAH